MKRASRCRWFWMPEAATLQGRSNRSGGGDLPEIVALPFFAPQQDIANCGHMRVEALENAWVWSAGAPGYGQGGAIFLPAGDLSGLDPLQRNALACALLEKSAITTSAPCPAGFRVTSEVVTRNTLKIGDAALARDPIASHGLVHALRSAVQGAAAIATVCDPDGDSSAAYEFVETAHCRDSAAAAEATRRAYQDQARYVGGFWDQVAKRPHPAETQLHAKSLSGKLSLVAPLATVPVLAGARICRSPALFLPHSAEHTHSLGPFDARLLSTLLSEPGSITELATRLGPHAPPDVVTGVLEKLVAEGALAARTAHAG